jgi:hypothetical protein
VNVYISEEGKQQRIWTEHFNLNHGPSLIEQFLADCVPSAATPYVVPSPTPFEDARFRLQCVYPGNSDEHTRDH